jgi:hypothetical protein
VGGILVTQHTWERVNALYKFREKREIVVKGYNDLIDGYEVDFEALS